MEISGLFLFLLHVEIQNMYVPKLNAPQVDKNNHNIALE